MSLADIFCNGTSEATSLDELAKMQSSKYWIERAFQDAKGNCGMAELMEMLITTKMEETKIVRYKFSKLCEFGWK